MRFSFKLWEGRTNRESYLVGSLVYTVLFLLVVISLGILPCHYFCPFYHELSFTSFSDILAGILITLLAIFSTFLQVRRYHDLGETGKQSVWGILTVEQQRLLFKKGQSKTNTYGKPTGSKITLKGIFGLF